MESKDAKLYLKSLNLEEDDISILFQTEVNNVKVKNDERDDFDRFYAKYTVSHSPNSEIGLVSFYVVDASKMHVSEIREIADGMEFNLYEALSSVRIFIDEMEMDYEKGTGYEVYYEFETSEFILKMKEKMKILKQQGLSPYNDGFEQYTFEKLPYHKDTINIWGKILVIDDIEIYSLFNKAFLTEELIKQLCESLKYVGFFDWLIVNPNIDNQHYFANNNYPVSSFEEYNALLNKAGFTKTYGKLKKGRFCYCMKLIND